MSDEVQDLSRGTAEALEDWYKLLRWVAQRDDEGAWGWQERRRRMQQEQKEEQGWQGLT